MNDPGGDADDIIRADLSDLMANSETRFTSEKNNDLVVLAMEMRSQSAAGANERNGCAGTFGVMDVRHRDKLVLERRLPIPH